MLRSISKSSSSNNESPNSSISVAVCVTQQVKHGREKDFESWLKGIAKAAEQFVGHQGINVIKPAVHSQEYTYIFRFDSDEHLQKWEVSAEKDRWVSRLQGLTQKPAKKQTLTGLEYWFTLPNNLMRQAPPRYKMVLVTILAIYPLTTILGFVVTSGSVTVSRLLKGLIVSVLAVTLMTYVVMPRMTRLFAGCLFEDIKT